MANSNFYANIGVNAGFTRSRSNTSSHTEGAAVTTLKLMDENSSITYSNVNSITYQGTQAQGGTFIYNNVANIQKEAVELHNSYSSSSSSRGISAGATIGYGHKLQTTGNGGSISASRSSQNTVETIYANGNFKNVNEVHNNTGSMVLNGFNQEDGKVTGNIGKMEVISRQNTSTTTGSSRGISVGVNANGVPSSVNINGSRTNGDRAFVDNQSTFIVGEGSSLHVGTLENTGAVIGKEGNSTFKIDTYVGKDIQNYDTMTTTRGSIGASLGGKPKITNVGFNQDSRDKQGITRNTVIGDVEIGETSGSPINRDITRANEVTKDTHNSTNINVESQTIEYATNPAKLKEDIGKAKKEISDVKKAIKESINDRGDDNRNFFGQLREVRLSETVNNIAGKRLTEAQKSEDVVSAWKDAYKDLGYNVDVKYTTGEDTPEMKNKAGRAYVSKDGVHTIIININAKENSTKAGLIGTLAEEASHIVNGVAGRQIETGTKEKGLESTGRAANAYFQEEYKGSSQNMTYKSDGKIDTSKLGTNVGDIVYINGFKDDKIYKMGKDTLALSFISNNISLLRDKDRRWYDKSLVDQTINDLTNLLEEGNIWGEINDTQNIVNYYQLRDKSGKIIGDKLDYEEVKEGKDKGKVKLIVKENSKDNLDISDKSLREAINDENYITFVKVVKNDKNEKVQEFFKNFENRVKNSKLPKDKKKELLEKYEKNWDKIYEPKNFEIMDNDNNKISMKASIIYFISDKKEENYITLKKNENGLPILPIKITDDNNITATVRHETQHSNDKSTRLNEGKMKILKKNSMTKTFEKNGMIYSSDNYSIDETNKQVIFFGIEKDEFNTVTVEGQVQQRMNRPVRALYNEENWLEKNKIEIPYKENMNINKSFQELMNKNAEK